MTFHVGALGRCLAVLVVIAPVLGFAINVRLNALTGASNGGQEYTQPAPPTDLQNGAVCTAETTESVVRDFVDALDLGDIVRLDALVAQEHRFQWYSTDAPGERFDPEARDRSSLAQYFAARHANGETLGLLRFQFNGISSDYANFEFDLIRGADDLPPAKYLGKGALDCDSQPPTVAVWSMARNQTTIAESGPWELQRAFLAFTLGLPPLGVSRQ